MLHKESPVKRYIADDDSQQLDKDDIKAEDPTMTEEKPISPATEDTDTGTSSSGDDTSSRKPSVKKPRQLAVHVPYEREEIDELPNLPEANPHEFAATKKSENVDGSKPATCCTIM